MICCKNVLFCNSNKNRVFDKKKVYCDFIWFANIWVPLRSIPDLFGRHPKSLQTNQLSELDDLGTTFLVVSNARTTWRSHVQRLIGTLSQHLIFHQKLVISTSNSSLNLIWLSFNRFSKPFTQNLTKDAKNFKFRYQTICDWNCLKVVKDNEHPVSEWDGTLRQWN